MTYRLNEIKDFLMNEDEGLNEDLYDKLYDLFCSEWSSQVTLSLPEFKINEKTYSEKTFKFTKQIFCKSSFSKIFSKCPNGFFVWNFIACFQS